MKNCCFITNNDKKCVRSKGKKTFTLPRKYSKNECLTKKWKGFSMRSSCSPWKYCKRIKKSPKNILNENLKICSLNPITGFNRDGYCKTGKDDLGTHTVCSKMTKKFMDYTKSQGNDLYSVVKPGQNWCLCENRWNQAFNNGFSPRVIKKSTNIKTNKNIIKNIFNQNNE